MIIDKAVQGLTGGGLPCASAENGSSDHKTRIVGLALSRCLLSAVKFCDHAACKRQSFAISIPLPITDEVFIDEVCIDKSSWPDYTHEVNHFFH
jgi:hypothetical protein